MIFKNRRFLVGGMLSMYTQKEIKGEAEWFNVDCIRLVDSVMFLLTNVKVFKGADLDEILKCMFENNKASSLPAPYPTWQNIQHPILRLYYHIMRSINRESPIRYLQAHIKIDGKFVSVADPDGQGIN